MPIVQPEVFLGGVASTPSTHVHDSHGCRPILQSARTEKDHGQTQRNALISRVGKDRTRHEKNHRPA